MKIFAQNSLYPKRWLWSGRIWILLVVWFMVSSFLGRSMANIWPEFFPEGVTRICSWLGYDWMAGCFAWAVLLLLIDLIFCLAKKSFVFRSSGHVLMYKNIAVCFFLAIYFIVGSYQALSAHWTTYEITLDKGISGLSDVNVVCVSDLHLGELIRSNRLEQWVEEINAKQPDLICLAGDIFDRGCYALEDDEEDCKALLSELSAPMGVYACIGNHDMGWADEEGAEQVEEWLEDAGIELLLDRFVVTNGLVIAGKHFSWEAEDEKKTLEFLAAVPQESPVILLDHKPGYLADAEKAGVDLVLSGHTHKGQIFPGNLFTAYLYETDYGYATNGTSQIVVSSGVGTWGPVLRWGSRSELVQIQLHFQ